MLNITEVRVHLLPTSTTNLKAYASITLDGCFVLHGLRVLQGTEGLFVGMPRRKRQGLPPQDLAHPLNIETRRHIEAEVLKTFHAQAEEEGFNVGNAQEVFPGNYQQGE